MTDRRVLVLDSSIAAAPEVGRWLAALQDARERTLRVVVGAPPHAIDWIPSAGGNSLGSLLYHIAYIEADWLFEDILGPESGCCVPLDLFPFEVREEGGILTPVLGMSLAEHLARLEATRTTLLECLQGMSPRELDLVRQRADYDVSPAWVLHHLLQHEAEHRAHIATLRTDAEIHR